MRNRHCSAAIALSLALAGCVTPSGLTGPSAFVPADAVGYRGVWVQSLTPEEAAMPDVKDRAAIKMGHEGVQRRACHELDVQYDTMIGPERMKDGNYAIRIVYHCGVDRP